MNIPTMVFIKSITIDVNNKPIVEQENILPFRCANRHSPLIRRHLLSRRRDYPVNWFSALLTSSHGLIPFEFRQFPLIQREQSKHDSNHA
jgi:hypothetical protein